MKRTRIARAGARVGWGALLACIVACGQSANGGSSGPSVAIDLGLSLAPGVTVSQAVYTISAPNGFFSAGSVAVGESADVPVVLEHLPVGLGYTLEMTAPASDGQTIC